MDAPSRTELERLCLENLLANPEERVFFKDLDSRFLMVSDAWLVAVGQERSRAYVIGKTDFDIFTLPHATEAFEDEQRIIRTGLPLVAKIERETFSDRPDRWVSTTKMPLRSEQGRIVGTFGISRDITAMVNAHEAMAYHALHDSVTGLASRVALLDRLEQALLSLERQPGRLAVLFIDLDGFKAVNDSLGHDQGDRVLAEIGRRLRRVARRADTVARLGGDEFVMLCPSLGSEAEIPVIAERVMRALSAPLDDGRAMRVTASIGVAATTDSRVDPTKLLDQADSAMYVAKRGGQNRYEMFDTRAPEHCPSAGGLVSDLRRGLDRGELFLMYQPLCRLGDGELTGVEAFVRWLHPDRGVLLPLEFLPLADQHALAGAIDRFVLDQALGQLATWTARDASWRGRAMSVNLSSSALRDPQLVSLVAGALERHRIEAGRLCLDISEKTLIAGLEEIRGVLVSLSALGVKIAIDDSGTGYSFGQLGELCADVLKIDRKRVAAVAANPRNGAILRAVTTMAHALGMTVVGEGVESQAEREQLSAADFDQAQGYLFAAPVAAREIEARWLTDRITAAA